MPPVRCDVNVVILACALYCTHAAAQCGWLANNQMLGLCCSNGAYLSTSTLLSLLLQQLEGQLLQAGQHRQQLPGACSRQVQLRPQEMHQRQRL
jgi:hypothetical protein